MSHPRPTWLTLCAFAVATLAGLAMSGCGAGLEAGPTALQGSAVHGTLMGGQQPVSGATIAVVAIGTSGYGVAGATLASTTTDANGNYSFGAGAYTCPSATTQVLFTARGGNPGLAAGTNNTALYLTLFAGPCGQLTPSTLLIINEVTTVAAAYVLRPFQLSNAVGTSSTNAAGLAAAYDTYSNLVVNSTGRAPGAAVPAGLVVPAARINSLANSIASCVNSSSQTSTGCTALFSAAGSSSSGNTGNTWVALNAIATLPAANPAAVYNLAGSTPPFQPALSAAPADWSLPLLHTGGNLKANARGLDIDTNGNVWLGTDAGFGGTVEEVSNAGTVLKTNLLNGAADQISSLAVSPAGGLVVTSSASTDPSVIHLTDAGVADTTVTSVQAPASAFYTGAASSLYAAGWVERPGASNSYLDVYTAFQSGLNLVSTVSSTSVPYTSRSSYGPNGDAYADSFGTLRRFKLVYGTLGYSWTQTDSTALFNSSGSYTYYSCQFSFGSTYDFCNHDFYVGTPIPPLVYSELVTLIRSTPSVKNQVDLPTNMGDGQIDGSGQFWGAAANSGSANGALPIRVVRVSSPELTGATASTINSADNSNNHFGSIRIDRSGNVWAARTSGGTTDAGLLELVGAAAPTYTPLAYCSVNNVCGQRP